MTEGREASASRLTADERYHIMETAHRGHIIEAIKLAGIEMPESLDDGPLRNFQLWDTLESGISKLKADNAYLVRSVMLLQAKP